MRFNSKEDRHREGIKAPSDGLGHGSQHYRDTVHGHRWGGGVWNFLKPNIIITIWCKIPTFLLEEGRRGWGVKKGIFFQLRSPLSCCDSHTHILCVCLLYIVYGKNFSVYCLWDQVTEMDQGEPSLATRRMSTFSSKLWSWCSMCPLLVFFWNLQLTEPLASIQGKKLNPQRNFLLRVRFLYVLNPLF